MDQGIQLIRIEELLNLYGILINSNVIRDFYRN